MTTLRSVIAFNDDWLYYAGDVGADVPDSQFQPVTLPHTNVVLPHHNFDNAEYQFISTYRKHFRLPEARNGRRVYVDFDGAMIACEVFLNGHKVGENEGGYTPFSFDLTDYLNETGDNLLTVRLDSTERPDIPPYGNVVDYLTFGGIYRDVKLRYVELCHIEKVFVRTLDVLTDKPRLEIEITMRNQGPETGAELGASIYNADGEEVTFSDIWASVPGYSTETFVLNGFNLPQISLWSLDTPTLYSVKFWFGSEVQISENPLQFGFREAVFRDDGFYLNGKKVKLRGLNRHQTYPYIGAAAPARLQRKDADILKDEFGVNIVRTSHYPQSPHFLNRCDEIGLLVFEEIPGWQHIGDQDWQGITLRDVQAMIERDRNHPSIILWGVRINESFDNEAFYTATNALAHKLDPTRQTGGVRNFRGSQFLEDVYTYNDFSNTVLEPDFTPHLVTEFNGHMFPTKAWDQEERQVEHALRHARIQDKAVSLERVTGAIGWCAFDYNTHQEFGSGDRICYHGVSDIFRLPKFAAYFYESQLDPAIRPVIRPATFWTMGDCSEGGINPLVIFSNCDEVEVFFGKERFGQFPPDRAAFPHLPHPPFVIKGLSLLWGGHTYDDLRVVGYINGQAVAEHRISTRGVPHALTLTPDDTELYADGADMTRLVFKIVDEYGNRLPYTNQVVSFELEGPAELIGENPFALMGGQAALYVKAKREAGTVTIRATTPRLELAVATIQMR
ncbi:MAG TPA: glycoside hydrolase family 2 TIM barrel-domain containing protein [Phototrophicaceae bacterium]|nr:glycoside hydrolase family 2 TIM barrel-domain containing protein [Phototrophicaceae bacterium]